MISSFGVSVYLSSGFEKNKEVIDRAKSNGFNIVFTSFHITEEGSHNNLKNIKEIIDYCSKENIFLCADVSIKTLDLLGLNSINDLYELGLSCVRFDYGIDIHTMAKISKDHMIMINASNLNESILNQYKDEEMNFKNVIAAHNYYPKSHTGLGLDYVTKMNSLCSKYGMKTLAFIPGFKQARGPIYEYLPTVESHRNRPTLVSLMELRFEAKTDYILIGDIDYDNSLNTSIKKVLDNIVVLDTNIYEIDVKNVLLNKILSNRHDLSADTIRIVGSRENNLSDLVELKSREDGLFYAGDIIVSNKFYLRYKNEVEIVLNEFNRNDKLNLLGKVHVDYVSSLKFISNERSFILVDLTNA